MHKTGVYFTLLLEDNIHFGKLITVHKNHAQNKLKLRNVDSLTTDGIWMLAVKIKEVNIQGGVI